MATFWLVLGLMLAKKNEMEENVNINLSISGDTYRNQGIRKENVQQLEEVKAKVCKTSARLKEAENHILDMEEQIQTTEDAVTELLKLQSKLK